MKTKIYCGVLSYDTV